MAWPWTPNLKYGQRRVKEVERHKNWINHRGTPGGRGARGQGLLFVPLPQHMGMWAGATVCPGYPPNALHAYTPHTYNPV